MGKSSCEVVYARLDYLDRLAAQADVASRAALADTEIPRLVTAWRALLAAHHPDRHGRCPSCSRWRRPRPHPCPVWATAHQHLIADTPPSAATHRHDASAPPRATPSTVHDTTSGGGGGGRNERPARRAGGGP